MSFLTFSQLQANDSGLIQIASADPSTGEFRRLVNEAVELLLNRGDWRGTLAPIFVCVQHGCVTWPRYVHSVRKLNICDREVGVNNIWYQFVDRDFYSNRIGEHYWNVVRPLAPNESYRQMNAVGYYSTYTDVPTPSYIQAYPTLPEDVGQTLTIFGYDTNGNVLRTKTASGLWQDGINIVLQAPYGQSAVALQPGAIRVVKPVTQGDVRLYAADSTTGLLTDLAVYAPSETTPSYARYQLHAHHHCGDGCNLFGVLALVKLEFIPVSQPNDLVLIDNMEALKLAVQGIKLREAQDAEGGRKYINEAIEALNRELQNETPSWQTPVVFHGMGKANPRRHSIGHMI